MPVSRLAKPALVPVALVALAASLSACAQLKSSSLQLSQPAGIGAVKVHFELCTEIGPDEDCGPNEDEGQSQYMLALAVPKGSVAPQSITAIPHGEGAAIRFTRNEEVTKALQDFVQEVESEGTYPPEGMESAGYLSSVFDEEKGEIREWLVDFEMSPPMAAADGGIFGGPFSTSVIFGWRLVDGMHPADRPVDCYEPVGESPADATSGCAQSAFAEVGISDLRIGAPAPVAAFVGGATTIAFPIEFASSVSPPPSFALGATSTLPKAALKLSSPTYAAAALDPTTHRASAESRSVTVTVPKNATPGTYDVTVSATAPQGGVVSQVAKLKVTKPKLKLGGVKLNKSKGTATLAVKVPSAGTLTVAGKDVVKVKKKPQKAKTLKITIRAKGKTKAMLKETGKAKLKAKVSFKPTSGIAVKKTKSVKLAVRP